VLCAADKMSDTTLQEELNRPSSGTRPKLTKTGKILLAVTGASFVGVFAATLPFVLPAARRICLPYVPATTAQVDNVMLLLSRRKPGRLIDLGSGDGRIVIEAARRGFQVGCVNLLVAAYGVQRHYMQRPGRSVRPSVGRSVRAHLRCQYLENAQAD